MYALDPPLFFERYYQVISNDLMMNGTKTHFLVFILTRELLSTLLSSATEDSSWRRRICTINKRCSQKWARPGTSSYCRTCKTTCPENIFEETYGVVKMTHGNIKTCSSFICLYVMDQGGLQSIFQLDDAILPFISWRFFNWLCKHWIGRYSRICWDDTFPVGPKRGHRRMGIETPRMVSLAQYCSMGE